MPAGSFLQGSLASQGDPDERPQREIYLDAFYIAKYPVTNRQYRKFLEQTGYKAPLLWNDPQCNQDEQPVAGVSWDDAHAYCQWAGLRLASEAEWEKAAGWDEPNKLKRWWPWGDTEPDPERANYADNVSRTTPVGSYPMGCCQDMAGKSGNGSGTGYNYYAKGPSGRTKCLRRRLVPPPLRLPDHHLPLLYSTRRMWKPAFAAPRAPPERPSSDQASLLFPP